MIPGGQIDLGKVLGAVQAVHELLDLGERVPILGRYFVQSPVVNTEPPFPILLRDE